MAKYLAIIPARGGSKRIPRKNIKDFLGQPILSRVIKKTIDAKIFTEVMVSTEDDEIVSVAKDAGANVPFVRTTENANDYASTADVILEVIESYKKIGKEFDYICCIYPTSVFVSKESLIKGKEILDSSESLEGVFSVMKFSFPIQRALEVNDQGLINMVQPEHMFSRSQDLPERYHDAAQFYFLKTSSFITQKKMYATKSSFVELSPMEAQDIDTMEDWQMAEMKFSIMEQR